MFSRRVLLTTVRGAPARLGSRSKATASHEIEGPAESSKRAAYGIFGNGMIPLVLLTIGVGYAGYNFRKNVQLGPEESSLEKVKGKTMEDLKKEVGSEREFVQKTIQAVNQDRDKKDELVWSKGTLEKNSFESSPEGSPNKKPSDIRK